MLLQRLFHRNDSDLYKLGREANIAWFDRFAPKFEKDIYAYFSDEERKQGLEKVVSIIPSARFVSVVNTVFREKERFLTIDRFVGTRYYFDPVVGIALDNRQEEIRQGVRDAIKDTKGRGYFFLRAIVELYRENRWDRGYGGATWTDILAKTRELDGSYPAPRDIMLLKSYRLYYKTGSRRYPTHTIPEEIIDIVEEVLSEET